MHAIPEILKDAPQFLLDNPIALRRKSVALKDNPSMKKAMMELQKAAKWAEGRALKTLGDLFDWLDTLEPQLTTEIVALYEKSQGLHAKITNTVVQMDQAVAMGMEIDKLRNQLKKKSTVSCFAFPASGARVSCLLYAGRAYIYQL
jgi:hypothetical protein